MAPNEDFGPAGNTETKAEFSRELRAIRPRPSESFRRGLDRRAAAGFPPRRRDHASAPTRDEDPQPSSGRASWRERLRLPGSLRLGPVLAGVAAACAVATAVVVAGPDQLRPGDGGGDGGDASVATMKVAPTAGRQTEGGAGAAGDAGTEETTDPVMPDAALNKVDSPAPAAGAQRQYFFEEFERTSADRAGGGAGAPIAADRNRRAVERDASVTLATEPAEVDEVAAGVLRVVGSYGGIVMSSTTRGGLEGEAGAEFALKIPSGRLGEALADLSDLAPVRHRTESSLDITAPTVTVSDELREARAKVRGLLKQLAAATSDEERETIEIDLAPAQRRVARLRSQLDRLERRANFADVSVAIVTGEAGAPPEEDGWTIGAAADDALHVLTVVAGVLLVAAAILGPIGLLLLAGWGVRRLWLRHARERALRGQS